MVTSKPFTNHASSFYIVGRVLIFCNDKLDLTSSSCTALEIEFLSFSLLIKSLVSYFISEVLSTFEFDSFILSVSCILGVDDDIESLFFDLDATSPKACVNGVNGIEGISIISSSWSGDTYV